ncbi:DUF1573 domain-containing protein [Bacteroides bouchesdurhonensis]
MKNAFTLILFLYLAISCHDSKKNQLSNLVKEWSGKEIQFPSHLTFTVQGKDTVNFDYLHSTYKIIMYADSMGCLSCKLQLSKWKTFMQEVDSLRDQNKAVSFVFCFFPKNRQMLQNVLCYEHFVHPVCIDAQDEFNKLNHFPSEIAFQTFLLDRDNRVIAIGNPIRNPKVKELYLKLIRGEAKTTEEQVVTMGELSENKVDFGIFPKTEKQERIIELKNTGTEVLVIQDVTTSCGCTKLEFERTPVPVGDKRVLKIIYEADNSGYFQKTVDVFCNIDSSPLRINVIGEAKDK